MRAPGSLLVPVALLLVALVAAPAAFAADG